MTYLSRFMSVLCSGSLLIVFTACSSSVAITGAGGGGAGAASSSAASAAGGGSTCVQQATELLPDEWKGVCSDGVEHFTDAASFQSFVAQCWTGNGPPPSIDFSTKEVWKIEDGFIDCPFEGSPLRLGFLQCGSGALQEHVWAFSDHCHCDYFERLISVVVVDAGSYPGVTRVRHEEAACNDMLCNCGGTEMLCSDPAFSPPCVPVGLQNGEDGLPPSWP